MHLLAHRVIVFCNKDEVTRAFELCKQGHFDDYVLFWPLTNDAPRPAMAILLALRALQEQSASSTNGRQLALQARRVADLEPELDRYVVQGSEQVNQVMQALQQAQADIGEAISGILSRQEPDDPTATQSGTEKRDAQQEVQRFKDGPLAHGIDSVTAALGPVKQWTSNLKGNLEPQLESARKLQDVTKDIKPHIFVVDDDLFQHKLLARMLENENLTLTFATSGIEALSLMRAHQPDLVLMDVNLPELSGIETTQRIRAVKKFSTIPIMMITGDSEQHVVVNSLKAGASDFIVKPVQKERLLAKVTALIEGA